MMMAHRVCPEQTPKLSQNCVGEHVTTTNNLSPTVMKLTWIAFVLLHFLCFLYFALVGWCYWHLPYTRLDAWLSMLSIGIGTEYYHPIALIYGFVAMVHAIYTLLMIVLSCSRKSVVFSITNGIKLPDYIKGVGTRWGRIAPLRHGIVWICRAVFKQDGSFGVDGPYFDNVLLFREIVETALQTYQAYRNSLLLPRKGINRIFVALLVLNCWSTALVHSFFHGHVHKRRLLMLACDCFLDFVSSMGITILLVASYIPDFDFHNNGFPFLKWYEDVWRVNAMSEFEIIFVASWTDMASRFVFALSMLGSMNNMKKLTHIKPASSYKSATSNLRRAKAVAPFNEISINSTNGAFNGNQRFLRYWVEKAKQGCFLLWGFIVLALHVYAESTPELSQCTMQVKPWLTSRAFCSLLELNCYSSGFGGARADVSAQWSEFDPATVVRVVIRHCPSLEIPVTLTQFVGLKEIKIYNSTISSWSDEAAIAQAFHPLLTTLFLVRVNMSNGELPLGLQADDFPQLLEDIELCVTNLHFLPEDLDLKWPQYASIYLEASHFNQVPPPLVRLGPFDLSLSQNPISTIPKELFETESVAYLNFGSTLVSELPEDVSNIASSVYDFNLRDTSVSFFWSWIDSLAITPTEIPWISAGSTPYCSDLQHIFDKQRDDFSNSPPIQSEVSILQNASMGNWAVLKNAVSCEKLSNLWYPLDFEDEYSKIV